MADIKINSLWIGGPLSTLERLSIASHLQQGHEYHLWTYEPLEAPEGVVIEDGNEILPASEIFCYSGPSKDGGGSVSAFSNWFRYKLLMERGGWWCDTDVVCLRPFDFGRDYVIASEGQRPWKQGDPTATTCVFKVPPNSPLMIYCWQRCQEMGRGVKWGKIGPHLLSESVSFHHLPEAVVPHWVFCPIHWYSFEDLFTPFPLGKSYAVHLWNEMWRRNGIDKDEEFDKNCMYERLKSAILQHL